MSKKLSDSLALKIYNILAKSPIPLKAMDISNRLKVKRGLVNRALYGKLDKVVTQDDDFCWKVTAPFRANNDHLFMDIDEKKEDDGDNAPQALFGSTIDIIYLSGPSKGKEKRLTLVSNSEDPNTIVKYDSIPTRLNSPIGAALYNQSQGDIVEYRIDGTNAAVLIKSISLPTKVNLKNNHKDPIEMQKTVPPSKPIKVYENESHFLVEISASQKERASDIPKRRWNRHLTAWVYPKTTELYDALQAEFQHDAEVFDIKRPAVPRVSLEEMESSIEKFKERNAENRKSAQEKLDQQFNAVLDKLDGLTKHVEKIEDSHDAMQELFIEQGTKAVKHTANNENEHQVADDEPLEMALILIAFEASGRDESFKKHLSNHHPITKPERFITRTHELLHKELVKIAGETDTIHYRFHEVVSFLRSNKLLNDTAKKSIYHTLNALNSFRNTIAHPKELSDSELKSHAISYLMGIAYVWDEVASEPV